ncbi:MAG TPA: HAMP domain-containing protein, partial [Anaeromyxobacteraceae bacterium]|nr:HAMP domain-containing protein [Anaeromyxobacteraceae bacterium]
RSMRTILAAAALATLALLAFAVLLSRRIGVTIRALVAEAGKLRGAVAAGRLDVRGDTARIAPEFRPIVEGFNETLDAFVAPIRTTADAIDRIAAGAVPARLDVRYEGDFDAIVQNLNQAIDAVNALVEDASMLAAAGVQGRLATRADVARHRGDFRRVVQGVNDTLDAFARPTGLAAECIAGIARGEIPPRITTDLPGDFAQVGVNLNRCIDAINLLVSDTDLLAAAGMNGQLTVRADAGRHHGDFRKIVEGVNRSFDAVVRPLQMTAGHLEAIARGAIPAPIEEEYRGDYAAVRRSLNTCIAAINRLVGDAGALVESAVAGRLAIRADASAHEGDFRKIVEGINRTLDAIVAPIDESAAVLERLAHRDLGARATGSYPGDYARFKDSLNATAEALSGALSQVAAAVEQV